MKKIFSIGLLLSALLFAATAANADSVNMYFTGSTGGSTDGVPTYPYGFQVNGQNANLLCDTFNVEISGGQQWNANILQLSNINLVNVAGLEFGGLNNALNLYLAAGYLFEQQIASPNNGLLNWAIWYLFDPTDVSNSLSGNPGDLSTVEGYASAALGMNLTPGSAGFANIFIYTAIPPGSAQEFFGWDSPTPEPGSMALFGTGVIGVAVVMRRRMKNSSSI